MIPLDKEKIMVESGEDIVIRFNDDPYRGRSRSVPSQKLYESAKCWTLENVSFPPPTIPGGLTPPRGTDRPVRRRENGFSHISNCARRGKFARPIITKMRHDSAGPPAGKLFLTLATAPGAANVLAPLKQRCGHGSSARRRKNCFSLPSFGAVVR